MARIKVNLLWDYPVKIAEMSGKEGDSIELKAEEDIAFNSRAEIVIFVEGIIEGRRKTGTLEGPGTSVNKAGDISYEYAREYETIAKGLFEMKIVSPFARYYCIKHAENKALKYSTHKLAKDQKRTIPKSRYLFVASGTYTVNGIPYKAPLLMEVAKKAAKLVATTDIVAIEITI